MRAQSRQHGPPRHRRGRLARLNAPHAQDARATRRYHPAFEGLEVRDLPSALTVVDHAVTAQHENSPNLNLVVATETKKVPQPTPREVRRGTLWAEFVGRYSVRPPRFSNQSATIHIFSNGAESQFDKAYN